MKIEINGSKYKLIENYRDCFDLDEIVEKLKDVDYFNEFDYILGDYAYDKLRLKGFYKKDSKGVNGTNNYEKKDEYLKNYCSYGCKYFVLEKEKTGSDKS